MKFGLVYPLYVNKAIKKGKTKEQVDTIIEWLTGYDAKGTQQVIEDNLNCEQFITQAPALNPLRSLIKGKVCGGRGEDVQDDIYRELRYLDKLIDELARGKKFENILRKPK